MVLVVVIRMFLVRLASSGVAGCRDPCVYRPVGSGSCVSGGSGLGIACPGVVDQCGHGTSSESGGSAEVSRLSGCLH